MNRKAIVSAALSLALCAGMNVTSYASNNLAGAMEQTSRRAVTTAIQEGIVPPGTSIYDCAYGKGADGVTRVVQYRDENGNWIDVATGMPVETQPVGNRPTVSADKPDAGNTASPMLSEETLAEYADEVFRIVNEEREKAGLDPLERDSLLDEAAMIRASEVHTVDEAGGEPHTRPDGTRWRTVLEDTEIDGDRCAENLNRSKATPERAMESWMDSDGHRDIILRDRYGTIGIGVYQRPDGKLDWIQIFERK